MAAATLKCLLDRRHNAMICTHRINPACGIPRFLSRFARRAGLVHLRQTFVLRCHGDDGWPLRAEASSNHGLLYAMARGRAPPPRQISHVGCLSATLSGAWMRRLGCWRMDGVW